MGHGTLIRPYGVVLSGRLELGLELLIEDRRVVELRPHTGIPEDFVVSPAFVNAHSHLEYRGMQGRLQATDYWSFIREITALKQQETPEQVREACMLAAVENRNTGVAFIAEHSDRPFAGEAMAAARLDGIIFQEVITFFEQESPAEKLDTVRRNAAQNRRHFPGPVVLTAHAPHTVDTATLRMLGHGNEPLSVHVAETLAERELWERGEGPIAEFFRGSGFEAPVTGTGPLGALLTFLSGEVRDRLQLVHCCDLDPADLELLAGAGMTVAHCPRSNERLGCPPAPIRELLDAGVNVGLGLDSPATGGEIDMFDEMRAALDVAERRHKPLTAEEVWSMSTTMGRRSAPVPITQPWDIFKGSETPLIKLNIAGASTTEELIQLGSAKVVEWI